MGAIFRHAMNQFKNEAAATKITGLAIASAGIDGTLTYAMRRGENPEESKAVSTGFAAASAAGWLFAEPLMWGITLGGAAKWAGEEMYQEIKKNKGIKAEFRNKIKDRQTDPYGNTTREGTFGGNFQDSQQAATMRQRQMQTMRQSRIATETVLGSEARQLHR